MGVDNLILRRVVVEVSGSLYHCSPPTLATVERACSVFGSEIYLLSRGFAESDAGIDAVHGAALHLAAGREADVADVLSTCVSPFPCADAVAPCLSAVLRLCDLQRIAGSMGGSAESGADNATRLVLELSAAYHVSPIEIVNEWPYEAVLSIVDAASGRAQNGAAAPGRLVPPDPSRVVKPLPLDWVN